MTETSGADPKERGRLTSGKALIAWAEIAGFWSLAIASPVYQRVTAGTESLTGLGIRRPDLVAFVLLVSLLVPTLLFLIEFLIVRVSRRPALQPVIQAVILGALTADWVWQRLESRGGILGTVVPLAVLALFIAVYLRTEFIPNFASILAIATPVVIVFFALSYPVRQDILPGPKPMADQTTDVKSPVVIVVLDELPLASLVNGQHQIDARFFPNLAKLQHGSTWYRRTLSVADNTLSAVPAILTGEQPTQGGLFTHRPPPGRVTYPDNVCTTAEQAGYQLYSRELVTDFCKRSDNIGTRLTALFKQGLPAVMPSFIPAEFRRPQTDNLTPYRFFENSVDAVADLFPAPDNDFGLDRDLTVKDFTRNLLTSDQSMNVIHVALPHAEYQYLPGGLRYGNRDFTDSETAAHSQVPVNRRESAKNMQQLTAQMMYTDHLVGNLIHHMKATGMWHKSLFVLTADHGVSFTLGSARRTLDEKNAGWLMPVPLFIKYPDQSTGKIVDRSVNSSDIEPTVMDALGLEPNPRSVGQSLIGGKIPDRKTVTGISSGAGPIEFKTKTVDREEDADIRERNDVFASGKLNAIGGHGALLGQPAAGHPGFRELSFTPEPSSDYKDVVLENDNVPAYFQATLPGVTHDPGPLAIALNGKIAATSRAWKRDGTWMTGVNIDPTGFLDGRNETAVYAINGK